MKKKTKKVVIQYIVLFAIIVILDLLIHFELNKHFWSAMFLCGIDNLLFRRIKD